MPTSDNIEPELEALTVELEGLSSEHGFSLTSNEGQIDDVLTYALFPQVGLKFLQNRNNPDAFEPVPTGKPAVPTNDAGEDIYTVEVEGKSYTVTVSAGGDISGIAAVGGQSELAPDVPASGGEPVSAPLAGNVVKILVKPGQRVSEGESIVVLEAMKMETSVSAPSGGTIVEVKVQAGDSCSVGDVLVTLA